MPTLFSQFICTRTVYIVFAVIALTVFALPRLYDSTNLIIVDSNVVDPAFFERSANKDAKVVFLDSNKNGLEQITAILAEHTNIQNLQIVSHGDIGKIYVGNSVLDQEELMANAELVAQWQSSFRKSASIALLGCDVAAQEGQHFIEQLATMTNTEVAGSTNTSSGLAGDWILEVYTGTKAPTLAFNMNELALYPYILNHFRSGTMSWSHESERDVRIKVDVV